MPRQIELTLDLIKFTPPCTLEWKVPPQGQKVGDSAIERVGNRFFIRNINGSLTHLSQVQKYLPELVPPAEPPKRKRVVQKKVRGKWGTNLKEVCAQAGIPVQTYYNRRRKGLTHEEALLKERIIITAKTRREGRIKRLKRSEMGEVWAKAARWSTDSKVAKAIDTLTIEDFYTNYYKGMAPKMAIMYAPKPMASREFARIHYGLMRGAKMLANAMPLVQEAFEGVPVDEGMMLAAKILATVKLFTSWQTKTNRLSEIALGRAIMAVINAEGDDGGVVSAPEGFITTDMPG